MAEDKGRPATNGELLRLLEEVRATVNRVEAPRGVDRSKRRTASQADGVGGGGHGVASCGWRTPAATGWPDCSRPVRPARVALHRALIFSG
jgi:hypothetical protein